MIKTNKYNEFVNEAIFSRTFEERMDVIDEYIFTLRRRQGNIGERDNQKQYKELFLLEKI